MKNITRTQYQAFPFHLVEPSPWDVLNKRYFTRNINPSKINTMLKVDYQFSEKCIKESIILSAIAKNNLLYPLHITKYIIAANELGLKMLNTIPDNNVVKLFVTDKLSNLIINSGEKVDYKSSAGVYNYKHKVSDNSYVGSAFNFKDRIKSHKDQFRNSENKFYNFIAESGGWDSLDYSILYGAPNLLKEFKSLNPLYNLSKGEIIFLVHITELLIKTLEQSVITNNSPSLNSELSVYFIYTSWDVEFLNQKALLSNKAKSVVVFSEHSNEPILGPLSIQQTTKILGISKDIVPRYLNFDRYFYSPVLLFKVKVLEMGISKFNYKDPNSFSHRAKVNHEKINFELEGLEVGKYFALDENKVMLSPNGYLSIREFCKDLDSIKFGELEKAGNYKFEYISRYINLNKLISTLRGNVYIVANP
jgi:hypothetical protein